MKRIRQILDGILTDQSRAALNQRLRAAALKRSTAVLKKRAQSVKTVSSAQRAGK